MLHFRSADAEGQRAERAMGGGVAVAADDGGAGQGPALLRADDMDDALARIVHGEIFDAEILARSWPAFPPARGDSGSAMPWSRSLVGTLWSATARVSSGRRTLRPASAQAFKGLGAGHFMDQMAVDIENGRLARLFLHQMRIPDLVVQRLGHDLPV